MSKKILLIGVCLLFFAKSHAGATENDTVKFNPEPFIFNFERNLDSIMNLWYVKLSRDSSHLLRDNVVLPDKIFSPGEVPDYPDSVYIERLARIPAVIDLSFNNIVRNYIDVYTKSRREQVEVMLGLAQYYFPKFKQILDLYDMPYELKYLPVVESALNPRAVSRAGASGIWQFMYGTARLYDLEINSLVDERLDPYASSHAAARYLKDLYETYDDWTLALAAYNCGPGNVNRAIRRAGGKRNYWEIYYFLPRETRGYVPAFIAATYTMSYYGEHNLVPRPVDFPASTDTVKINRELHLKQIAEVMDIPLKLLRDYNPQYRRDIIPAGNREYAIRMPDEYTTKFIDLQDSIFTYRSDELLAKENITASPVRTSFVPSPPSGTVELHYTVKPGDNLGHIAEWYNIRAQDIRHWNNIRGNLIRAGQRLTIYVPRDKAEYYREINDLTFDQKQARIGAGSSSSSGQASTSDAGDEDGYVYYTVRPGDSLWEISRRFTGVSEDQIIRLNNLTNSGRIYSGPRLKIKKSAAGPSEK